MIFDDVQNTDDRKDVFNVILGRNHDKNFLHLHQMGMDHHQKTDTFTVDEIETRKIKDEVLIRKIPGKLVNLVSHHVKSCLIHVSGKLHCLVAVFLIGGKDLKLQGWIIIVHIGRLISVYGLRGFLEDSIDPLGLAVQTYGKVSVFAAFRHVPG